MNAARPTRWTALRRWLGPSDLAPPVPTTEEAAAFGAWRFELLERTWKGLGLLVAAAAVAWWPLDALLFPDSAETRRGFALFRAGVVSFSLLMVVIGPRLRFLYGVAFGAVTVVLALEVAWAAAWMGKIGAGNHGWFGFFYLAPVFTVLLPVPLGQRIGAALLVGAAAWLAFHGASSGPAPLRWVAASQMLFSAGASTVVGSWLYDALAGQYILRRRLEAERSHIAQLNAGLHQRVIEQTADLRALSQQASHARIEERERLARDLHDDLGQELTALSLVAASIDPDQGLTRIQHLIGRSRDALVRVLDDLQPRLLDRHGLEDALRALLRERCAAAGIGAVVQVRAVDRPIPEATALAVFRCVQESLTNAIRHACATHVQLEVGQEGETLVVRFSDDGRGMAAVPPPGHGLPGMRARCAVLHGSLELSRGPNGRGTTIRIRLPLESEP